MVSSYVYFLEPLRGFLYTSHNTRFHLPEKRVQNLGLQILVVKVIFYIIDLLSNMTFDTFIRS